MCTEKEKIHLQTQSFRKFHARIIVRVPNDDSNKLLSIVIWYEEPFTNTSLLLGWASSLILDTRTMAQMIIIIWLLSTHPFYDNNNNNHGMMKGFNNNRKRKRNFNFQNILIMNHPFQLHAAAIAIAIPITCCKWIYTTNQPTNQLQNPLTLIFVENLPRFIRLLSFSFCKSNGKTETKSDLMLSWNF